MKIVLLVVILLLVLYNKNRGDNMEHRLRELRKQRSMNQSQIAEVIGVSQGLYSAYELGTRRLPVNIVIMLSEFYEVSTDYILGLTNLRYTDQEKKFFHDLTSKNISSLVKEYNLTLGEKSMSEEEQFLLIKLIKTFVLNK